MTSKYWIKLYHEILDDPKMGRLPDRLWRRVIELFLLAGEQDESGRLPSVADMAWRLRADEAELTQDLQAIETIGIITRHNGYIIVTRFADRQSAVSDAERMRRYRERKQAEQYYGDDDETLAERSANASVTNNVTSRNVDTDTDIDTDKDGGADAPACPETQPPPTPTTYTGWLERLRDAKANEAIATLTLMACTLYPDKLTLTDKGIHGRIGKLAKDAGSTSKLAGLLWSNAQRALVDPLDYIAGAIRREKQDAKPEAPTRPPQRFATVGG